MFQLKNFVSIAASMLNYVRSTTGKVTDLQPGSVTRTILEAPAAEIEELYVQVFNGIKEAIPVAVYKSINFNKLPPQYASGRVTVLANPAPTQPLDIPKGTQFLARDGRVYVTVNDSVWPANMTSLTFPVQSLTAGSSQNLAAGEINASPSFDPGVYTFSNTDMLGGTDTETDDARDIRFADYIASLSRGTEAAIIYGAKTAKLLDAAGNVTEAVGRVSLTVKSGTVKVNIWGTNGPPSLALLDRVTEIETGYKDPLTNEVVPGFSAAGISTTVAPMVENAVSVEYRVDMLTGYTFDKVLHPQQVKDALSSFLSTIQPGTTVYIDDIKNVALAVRGIKSATVNIKQNIVCGDTEVLTAGTVKVEETPKSGSAVTTPTTPVTNP
ncbi:hypothetical protein E0G74_00955 [Salmonella enterica]|nr:hypothetical protein [Salmonella enterica]